jgi:DNA polymerase III delta subunit
MLHVYFGNDVTTVRGLALGAVETLVAASPARVSKLEASSYAPGVIANLLGSVSLFGEQELYLIDTPSDDPDFYAEVTEAAEAMGESSNQFVIIEGALLAPEKKKFAPYASTMEETKQGASSTFNVFALAEAVAKKDKKSLWVLLQEAKRNGSSAEEIIGILWWQLKTMRIAAITGSAAEADMKDFSYNKAKSALRNFGPGELETVSLNLLKIYHAGHGGVRDIDEGLEEWVLGL